MRQTAPVRIVVAAAVLALSVSDLRGEPSAEPRPTLRPSAFAPLVLRGAGFLAHEHVRVTLRVGDRRASTRVTRADARGRFVVRYGGLLFVTDPCEGMLVASAAGSHGSRATYTRACRPPNRQR